MPFKLAVSSNGFKKHTFEEAVKIAAKIGYEGIEVLGEPPHLYAGEVSPEQISAAKNTIAKKGLTPSNVNAFTLEVIGDDFYHPSFIEPDSEKRQMRTKYTCEAVKMTRALGCQNLSIQPGGPLEKGVNRKQAYEFFAECLREIEPLLDETGVDLLIEPEPALLMEKVSELEEFFAFHDHPRLGMNFDIGHMFCVSEEIPRAVRKMKDKIRHVHIEDIAASREHKHLVPGDGAIDYGPVFETLEEIGYCGFVTVELYPYASTAEEVSRRAFDFLTSRFGQFFTIYG